MKRVLPLVILGALLEIIATIFLGIFIVTSLKHELLLAFTASAYLLFTAHLIPSLPFRFIALNDMYNKWKVPGKRFCKDCDWMPMTFIELRAPLYNYIDAFDFRPLWIKFKLFFGYENNLQNMARDS